MEGEFQLNIHPLAILDNMPYMAWYKDVDGRFTAANLPFADSIGKSRDEIIGKTAFDVWNYKAAVIYTSDDEEVIRTRTKKTTEILIDEKNGEIWLEIFKAPVFDDQDNVIGTIGMAKDITNRKVIEKKLKEQSKYSEKLLRMIPSAVYTLDNNMRITSWNDMSETITGYKAEEVMGMSAEHFCFHPCRDNCRLFSDVIVAPEFNLTCKIRNKNGEIRYILKNVDVLRNDKGEVTGRIECFDDITERVIVEDKLRESEWRLNLATSSARIGLWDWKVQTGEAVYNEQWANIIGYKLEELQPVSIDTWSSITHPGDFAGAAVLLDKCFRGETEYYEAEIRLKHKNGQWVWVLDRGRVTEWDSEKKPVRMTGTHIDITMRKQAEEELKKKERLLSAVALSIKELISDRDYIQSIVRCFELIGGAMLVDRAYLFINHYDEKGNGYTSQAVEWNSSIGESLLSNLELSNISFEEMGSFAEPLARGENYHGIVSEIKNDWVRKLLEAQKVLSIIVLPIMVKGVFWGFISFDECKYERVWTEAEFSILTAFANSLERTIGRSLMEAELEASKQSAEAANILKSQFIANVSHEIRTPMHAILGYTALMKETATEEESISYLNAIEKAGSMLMNLINDILDLSKIEAGKMELQTGYIDIRHLFEDIKEVFLLKAKEKHIQLKIDMDSTMPKYLLLDEARIRQILFNLVGNAVKFTENGYIRISASVKKQDENSKKLDIVFEVLDTGIGIPEDQQRSIFEPFKQKDGQSNKKYGGTGLGLSISKRLVDIMGGSISVRSKLNEGSTFIVEIPGISNEEHSIASILAQIEHDEQTASKSSADGNAIMTDITNISSEMINELELLEQGLWVESKNKNRMSDIRKLTWKILDIGIRYKNKEITNYANMLQEYINAFELKNIKEALEQFPEMLEHYKMELDKGGR